MSWHSWRDVAVGFEGVRNSEVAFILTQQEFPANGEPELAHSA